ncbi:MAG TPA: AlkA N-terminal domain-containing protein [Rhizomicrobium sp.]|nr:AlkA N-terminal domain-containing protein [Rhizomicrobium sp.]
MILDREACYRAVQTRDSRFDGRLFAGVRTTGIYCRPICPARTPKLENLTFFTNAAAAQEAGFRPCLRCRPECSPQIGAWRGTSNTVSRALVLIGDGFLDGKADVDALAARLGLGERQLRRLFQKHLGASPITVAQTRRIHLAKQLIHDTSMSMVDVALASGFGSVRRFNDSFHAMYGRPPSQLRRRTVRDPALTLSLSYVPPYDWPAMMSFFAARAIEGVEMVEADRYVRSIALNGAQGTISVSPIAGKNALAATIAFPDVAALPTIVARLRRMFDVGADIGAINAHLAKDQRLRPAIAARPGLRVPGAWDPFELAMRAVLGQQITVGAARKLGGRLVALCGTPLAQASAAAPALTHVFPSAAQVAAADLSTLGMPGARLRTLAAVANAALCERDLFSTASDLESAVTRLCALPGIGEWTAQYIALRALHEPDAFPASDVGLLRAMDETLGRRTMPDDLSAIAQDWRPWRAYAAQHLWTSDAGLAPRTARGKAA